MSYQGRAYQAPSGQWSWAISQDNVDIQGGAGYNSEDDALIAMEDELASHQEAEMATLTDLHNHAIAFALEQHAHEHSPSNSSRAQEMLAAGHWVTYYDDYLVPDVILREWPDGRMEIVDSDEKGNVLVVQELPNKSELRKRRDAIRSALGDAQMSGGYPSKKVKDLAEMYAIGRITLEEFLNAQRHEPGS